MLKLIVIVCWILSFAKSDPCSPPQRAKRAAHPQNCPEIAIDNFNPDRPDPEIAIDDFNPESEIGAYCSGNIKTTPKALTRRGAVRSVKFILY